MASPLALPDLEAFQAVPPRPDLKLEDFKLPDGTPMIGPDSLLVPAARTMNMIINSATRVFSYRSDEAMRDNFVAARAMRRDAFIRGLLEERLLPTINREFRLEVDDDRDPQQRYVRDALARIIRSIPDFDAFKRALLDAIWFGRAGAQWGYKRLDDVDDMWGISKWDPLHGDSVQFTFDGTPAILMDSMTAGWYASHGAERGAFGDIRPTDRGGTALILQRDYWRDRFAIHVHMREKADYLEGELAGSVQGLGLRGLVYWQYVVRTDALTWMLAYLQAVGMMDLLIFNYPAGNAAAQLKQEQNAQKVMGKVAIACPRKADADWPAVEQIPMNAAGLKALHEVVADYFDRHIERLIVGQSMSSGADKGTGLGGTGRAEFCKSTKDEILVYDTGRLDSTLTNDLLKPLKKYNFPWAKFPVRFKSVVPDLEAEKKVQSSKILVSMGVPLKLDEVREAGGFSRPEEGDEVIATVMPGAPPMIATMTAQGPMPEQPGTPVGTMLPGGVLPGIGTPGGLPNLQPQPVMPPAAQGAGASVAGAGPSDQPPSNNPPTPAASPDKPTEYFAAAGGAGMGMPGGSNSFLPGFKKEDDKVVAFTRYERGGKKPKTAKKKRRYPS
jgi:hypothetical protein